jgi:3-(3-hydroxy-phenyl)propionate hydroxylase
VLRWNAPDALLDTYERERRPHTRVYIETAVNVGQMMNNAETAETLTHAIKPDGSAQMKSISRGLAHAMGPADGHLAGTRMPQPVLADGRRLSDAMAGRFAVIAGHDALADNADHLPDDASALILDADAHEALADLLESQQVAAIAIRPDFYCYGGVLGNEKAAIAPFFSGLRAQISGTV